MIASLSPSGTLRALRITTPSAATLPGAQASGFPTPLYPAPVAVATSSPPAPSDPSSCPSPQGLVSFDAAARRGALQEAARFDSGRSGLWGDLRSSDRSWWPELFGEWTDAGYDTGQHRVVSEQPADRDGFAAAAAAACGSRLVHESVVVEVAPSAYSWQVSHLYVLDRDGRPLVWFQAS